MWTRGEVLVAVGDGKMQSLPGMVAKGLGLVLLRKGAIFRSPVYGVFHLGSGHMICRIEAQPVSAARVVEDLLGAGDWEFDGLDGWKNMAPTLSLKVQSVLTRHASIIRSADAAPDDFTARKIARERA